MRQQRRELQERQRAAKAEKGVSDRATKVLLVRHGETAWNFERRLQGQQDPPLNQLGTRQAEALASRLAAEGFGGVIYSSDLIRAYNTAETILGRLQPGLKARSSVQSETCFRERNLGILEGLSAAEAPGAVPEAWDALCSSDPLQRIPGGESVADVEKRAVEGVLRIAERHQGGLVLIVTHGGVLQALYRYAAGSEFSGRFKNCALNTLWVDGRTWSLGLWGDVSHLEGVGVQQEAFGGGDGG